MVSKWVHLPQVGIKVKRYLSYHHRQLKVQWTGLNNKIVDSKVPAGMGYLSSQEGILFLLAILQRRFQFWDLSRLCECKNEDLINWIFTLWWQIFCASAFFFRFQPAAFESVKQWCSLSSFSNLTHGQQKSYFKRWSLRSSVSTLNSAC